MKPWKKKVINIYFCVVRALYGVNKKKVAFISFGGKGYSDNPRALSEAVGKEIPEAEIVWFFQNPKDKRNIVPENIRCVDINHLWEACREVATASVYINNFALPRVPKSKKQLFIQTWHGDKAFKKVLHDVPGTSQKKVLSEQIEGYCDFAIAGSEYGEKQYRSAFQYKGKVLKIGTPRNDRLIVNDQQTVAAIKENLKIEKDVKILLYAPTLRKEETLSKKKLDIKEIDIPATLSKLEQRDGCKWVCLLRAHPAMVGLSVKGENTGIVDVSYYEDMADLLLISDMLITDYSSCAGDFALTGRPIVLFQADRQEYLEKDRSFYFDIEDSPYFVANSQEELEIILSGITEEKAKENCKKILDFYGDCETGHAADTVVGIIKKWIER